MKYTVTANGEYDFGDASRYKDPILVSWKATAGATGMIAVFTTNDSVKTRVSDSQADLTEIDNDGNVREQMLIRSHGEVTLQVTGLSGSVEVSLT